MPKPIPQSSSKNADHYNKMREISEKYGKLVSINHYFIYLQPLKPGFTRGPNVRLQHLSIDVTGSDYVSAGGAMPSLTSGNVSNRNAAGGMRTVQNRSKSIEPTAKNTAF